MRVRSTGGAKVITNRKLLRGALKPQSLGFSSIVSLFKMLFGAKFQGNVNLITHSTSLKFKLSSKAVSVL